MASLASIKTAVYSRRAHFLENVATLTMKQARRLLESDLGLKVKTLDDVEAKATVTKYVEKVLASAESNGGAASKENQAPVKSVKAKAVSKQASKAKDSGDEEEADEEGSDSEEGSEGSDVFGDSDSDSNAKKRKSKKHQDSKKPKKKKTAPAASKPAANPITGLTAKLRDTCKAAGLTYQHVFMKHKVDSDREQALELILSENGLSLNSSTDAINKCRAKVELAKDMDGIDTSNVIEGGRRRRAVATDAMGQPIDYAKLNGKKSVDDDSDEDLSSDDDEDSDDESEDEGMGIQSEDDLDDMKDTKGSKNADTAVLSDVEAEDIFFEDEDEEEVDAKKDDAQNETKKVSPSKVAEKVAPAEPKEVPAPVPKGPRRGGALYSDSDED